MADQDLFAAIQDYFSRINPPWIAVGHIESVTGSTVRAFVSNNAAAQQVLSGRGLIVNPGDQCLLIKPDKNARWIVVATFGTPVIGEKSAQQAREIAPPVGLSAISIAGYLYFYWQAPPQRSVAFEVQTSVTGTDGDAISVLVTRGSYYITTTPSTHVRVRSVDNEWHKSGWTAWLLGTAVSDPNAGLTNTVIDHNRDIASGYQLIVWEHITITAALTVEGELVIL